ncbi:penicillin-binding transpeptidase domain-containing protein [Nocardioides solisilvae]|uniref:penicillin-binding transpeptidase domain-containing protein n=1 Tax=Nocardioides solisilvae TaxID=1542435 RepID=UPI000D74852E|nr:penicillin-binding transpeptidase domain-containing protein [Nocardioides solisilvae]
MPRARLLVPPILCLVVPSLVLFGCSLLGDDDAPGPEEAAERLVEAVSGLDLVGVPLTEQVDAEDPLAALSEPLAERPRTVELLEVEETPETDEGEPARAVARLGWSWDVGGDFWDYESSASLVREGEEWRVEWAPTVLHPELVEGHTLAVRETAPMRGRVLGAGGQPIVVDRPVKRYGIDKAQTSPRGAVDGARQLAEAFDLDRRAYVEKVKAYGPQAFVEAIVLRVDEAAERVPSGFPGVPGAAVLDGSLPLAPTRDFAAELLGRVAPATAEIVEESEGRVRAGDEVGVSGLQARYDERLFGQRGLEVVALPDGNGTTEQVTLFSRDPVTGADLTTTLDPALQQRAEALLEPITGHASAAVVLRPSTGHVLAAATGPGSELPVATYGQYAPGSTFKVVSALALLRAGAEPGDVLPCAPTTTVDGRRFENYDDYPADRLGRTTLRTAFAHSCNTAMIDARDRLAEGDLAAAAASLGLGVDHDLGFPAYFGQVPAPGGETERAAAMIGQGKVLASPLAMAAVAGSVAAGRTVLPVLLPDQPAPQPTGAPLSAGEARQLRELMRAVVAEGSGRGLADLPGEVGAKTGTAEFGPEPSTHAWMIGYRDDLAVAVFVERGDSGSGTAGPILEALLR